MLLFVTAILPFMSDMLPFMCPMATPTLVTTL